MTSVLTAGRASIFEHPIVSLPIQEKTQHVVHYIKEEVLGIRAPTTTGLLWFTLGYFCIIPEYPTNEFELASPHPPPVGRRCRLSRQATTEDFIVLIIYTYMKLLVLSSLILA